MKRELTITSGPLDEAALALGRERSTKAGAVIVFLGVVRDEENSVPISILEYEAFEGMARHQFTKIFDQVETRWPIESIRLIHRIGAVGTGEASLWVEVMAPHRGEAFAACQFTIDEMKRVVPIWKKPVPVAS
ncbi:MAG: molybdenum cofactor biosynthesis protein MoaE [Verrucomicrobiales bacterium]|jgi:molybdopterin synthase catalytic subunit|nr:molybdenum cofactor biosynthesis protein MoaE [Verrucomicrobiales bacterium]